MNLEKLKEPFPADEVEWRVSRSGVKNGNPWAMVLAYITSRGVQDRLDAVCGPQNWRNEFRQVDGGTLCGISIKCGDEWVTKWDGAQNTDIESFKGGLSGAEKRAASQWGIGRYLYGLTENWAQPDPNGSHTDKVTDKQSGQVTWFRWNPPALPGWALPKGVLTGKTMEVTVQPPTGTGRPPASGSQPSTSITSVPQSQAVSSGPMPSAIKQAEQKIAQEAQRAGLNFDQESPHPGNEPPPPSDDDFPFATPQDKQQIAQQPPAPPRGRKSKADLIITGPMMKRMYAIAKSNGWSNDAMQLILKQKGYASMKDVKNGEYDEICAVFSTPMPPHFQAGG